MLLRTIVEALGKRAQRKEQSAARKNGRRRGGGRGRDSSPRRTNMPLAYALARSWAWPALKFRCETHPQEVAEIAVDNRGETILHWTCLGKPPIDTVQAILEVCPFMAQVRNKVGHLPLHVAISYRASVEVVRALLEAFPDSAGLANGVGAYPLHLLCDYGSCVDSLRAVLETEAGAATIDKPMRSNIGGGGHGTPLRILNSRMNYPVLRRAIQSMQEVRKRQEAIREAMLLQQSRRRRRRRSRIQRDEGLYHQSEYQQGQREELHQYPGDLRNDADGRSNDQHDDEALRAAFDRNERMISSFQQNDYWQKAALLVLVAYTQQPLSSQGLDHEDANLVHACAGISDCPNYLLEFAILLHMEDLIEKKDTQQGRLPLHVAAQNHAKSLLLQVNKSSSEGTKQQQQQQQQRRRSSRRGGNEDPLRMILEACPAAACVQDKNGDLPLAVAIKEIQQQQQHECNYNNNDAKTTTMTTWSIGLQQLLDANVAALETLNLEEGLYPYVWSRRMTSVEHLFQSIRRHPDLFDQSYNHRSAANNNRVIMDRTAGC